MTCEQEQEKSNTADCVFADLFGALLLFLAKFIFSQKCICIRAFRSIW